MASFNDLTAANAGLLMFFTPWSSFDPFLLDKLLEQLPASEMPTIVLSWEPGRTSTGCDLGYGGVGPLKAITQGNCDSYIRSFARSIGARPGRYILRFAHEMNITDSPWWVGYYGKNPADYVAAFRRIHDLFESEGARNVEWVWSPNYASNPYNETDYAWNDIHNYYPGEGYVDWIGLSGYNWGKPWRTFVEIYDEVLRDFTCTYAKPQLLLEVGSVEGADPTQTKSQWIRDMYSELSHYPFVRGVVWFNDYAYATRGQADFRVSTSTADVGSVEPLSNWTDAYRTMISGPRYVSQLPALTYATPARTMCVLPGQIEVSPTRALLRPGEVARFEVAGAALEEALTVVVEGMVPQSLSLPLTTLTLAPPWYSAEIHVQSYLTTPVGTYGLTVSAGDISIPLEVKVVDVKYGVYLPLTLSGR